MLYTGPIGGYGWSYDNWGANPSVTPGGLVTAGASPNTESATPLVLASAANLTNNVQLVELTVYNVSGTGNRSQLLDFGWDPAGGTSYTWAIEDIVCGNTAAAITTVVNGYRFLLPLYIPAGSAVAVRTQNAQASITTRVAAKFYGLPERPGTFPVGNIVQGFGTTTNSSGQTFTPGNAADGAWANLGTVTHPLWWWQLSYQISNATITAEYTYIDIAYGDASNKHVISRGMHMGTTAENCSDFMASNLSLSNFAAVPAGANIYVRGRCINAPDTGYNARVIGIGG